jgi:hypothetical protein
MPGGGLKISCSAVWAFILAVNLSCPGAENGKTRPGNPADSTVKAENLHPANDTLSTSVRIYEYIAYPTLQLITWPIETLLIPVIRAITYPTQEPIRYFLDENVIDRTRSLVSYGKRGQLQIYPTLSLAPGTGSRTGATLRENALFGRETERLVARVLYYVNGDYKVRTYVTADKILGTTVGGKFSAYVVRMKNVSVNMPDVDSFFVYSDASEQYQFELRHPLFSGFSARAILGLRPSRLSSLRTVPPGVTGSFRPLGDFFRNPWKGDSLDAGYRGIGQSFLDRSLGIGLARDTRNNENITLTGDWLNLGWNYHDVDLGHSYHNWEGQYTKYFQLGRERYEITAAEERRRGTMSAEKFLEQLDYEKLRAGIFSRKVVAVHFFAGQSVEIPDNHMPIYALQTLGNDTPLRGYEGSRFRDYTVAAFSTEYRFPLLRLMDGVLFDEYGVIGRSWDKIDYLDFKNSWGFGIHVRRPDIFLFRLEIGIHGLSGVMINMSVDTPY